MLPLTTHITQNRFFRWKEWVVSRDHPELAAKIVLSEQDRANIRFHVQMCLDPWRLAHPDNKLIILSGKRSDELNAAAGGSTNSDHLFGMAVDIYATDMTAQELYCSIQDQGLPYRQLILYQGKRFVHWSIYAPCKSVKHESIIKA